MAHNKKIDKKTQDTTALKTAIVDIARSLKTVFNRYSKTTRERAWDRITSKKGEKEVGKLLVNPNRDLNTFPQLVTSFREWLKLQEMSLTTRQREQYRRDVARALMALKLTAPEIFTFDEAGTPQHITINIEELIQKLHDRQLLPAGIDPSRFAATVKMFTHHPDEDRDFITPSGEGFDMNDYANVKRMREKYWGAYNNRSKMNPK